MGGITEIATSAPGYSSILPNTAAPLARTLKLNGYSTAQFGKCHEVPVWETSPVGPFDAWPTGGGGFEYFYGFIGGETNQWYPSLYEGTTPVEADEDARRGLSLYGRHDGQGHRLGGAAEGAHCRTSLSSSTSRRARPMRRITCRKNGRTNTKASSIRVGTSCARRSSLGRKSWASFRRMPADAAAQRNSRLGRNAGRDQARARPPDGGLRRISWSTPTIMSAG